MSGEEFQKTHLRRCPWSSGPSGLVLPGRRRQDAPTLKGRASDGQLWITGLTPSGIRCGAWVEPEAPLKTEEATRLVLT